jgi:hypothetical protein
MTFLSGLGAMRDASKLSGEVAQKMSQRHKTQSSIIQSHPLSDIFFLHLRMVLDFSEMYLSAAHPSNVSYPSVGENFSTSSTPIWLPHSLLL